MSALISMVRKDSVALVTDGAIYTNQGILIEVAEKVWRSDRLPLAISGRGDYDFLRRTAHSLLGLADNRSVDEFIAIVPGFLSVLSEGMKGTGGALEIVIAAISESRGAFHRGFVTHELDPSIPPFQLVELPRILAAGPALTVDELSAVGIDEQTINDAGEHVIELYGVQLMEACRRHRGHIHAADPNAATAYCIGGFCQLTVVSAEGCSTITLHTWPDIIGEPIDPLRHREKSFREAAE